MTDQANELRQLVLRSARSGPAVPYNAPCIIVLTSGKGGVGTTTIAVNLAAALARDGRRTVLVDADFKNADATKLCRVDATDTVAGVLVLPGAWGRAELVDCSETAQQRLLTQLVHLGAHADFVIVDIGSGASRVAARFWNAADRILLVTTPEAMAIMDTYALLKTLAASDRRNVGTLINNASSPRTATDAHQRLSRASKRFLGFELDSFGSIDEHPAIAAATAECQLLSTSSDPSAAAAFERLATTLTQSLPGRQTEPCVA
jgi:flagellar biosynthesis protein FlhG